MRRPSLVQAGNPGTPATPPNQSLALEASGRGPLPASPRSCVAHQLAERRRTSVDGSHCYMNLARSPAARPIAAARSRRASSTLRVARISVLPGSRGGRESSGIPKGVGPHSFRHYFATRLIHQGASVKRVQLALGHATPTITLNTYLGEWPDTDQETSAIMDAALGQVPRMCPPAGRLR
jgi:hypothetical protein